MTFEIRRASDYSYHGVKPCDKSYAIEATRTNIFDETVKYNKYLIDINTLDDLMDVIKRDGSIIIYPAHTDADMPSIVIYDDYVE